jgi:hypothetical protein
LSPSSKNSEKSKIYFTSSSVRNPWKLVKSLMKLISHLLARKLYANCYPVISLVQLISLLCSSPKIDLEIFNLLRMVIFKECGTDGGREWTALNIKAKSIDQILQTQERLVQELESTAWNVKIFIDVLFLHVGCLISLNDLQSAKMVTYKILEVAKQNNYVNVMKEATSQLATIYAASGDSEYALIFSMQAIQLETNGVSAIRLRNFIFAQCALASSQEEMLKILSSSHAAVIENREKYVASLPNVATKNDETVRFLQLKFDVLFARLGITNDLNLDLLQECLLDIVHVTNGKLPTFWVEYVLKIIQIFEDQIDGESCAKYDIEEAYLFLQNVQSSGLDPNVDLNLRCLLTKGLLVAKYLMHPGAYLKEEFPVVEKYLAGLDEKGNPIRKPKVVFSNLLFDSLWQQIMDSPSHTSHRNFFMAFESYLKWKSIGTDTLLGSLEDFKKEQRSRSIVAFNSCLETFLKKANLNYILIIAQAMLDMYTGNDNQLSFRFFLLIKIFWAITRHLSIIISESYLPKVFQCDNFQCASTFRRIWSPRSHKC